MGARCHGGDERGSAPPFSRQQGAARLGSAFLELAVSGAEFCWLAGDKGCGVRHREHALRNERPLIHRYLFGSHIIQSNKIFYKSTCFFPGVKLKSSLPGINKTSFWADIFIFLGKVFFSWSCWKCWWDAANEIWILSLISLSPGSQSF